jgi:phosphatidylglycerophosphate synthase
VTDRPAEDPGRAVLVVLPAAAPGPDPREKILGIEWARRIALGARRAGFGRVLFLLDPDAAVADLLHGTGAETTAPTESVLEGPARLVAVASDRLALPAWIERARALPLARREFAVAPAAALVCDLAPSELIRLERPAPVGVDALAARLREARTDSSEGLSLEGLPRLSSSRERREAESLLLASLVKDSEGFMSRNVERRISLALSRRLAGTPVSPNAMTLFSVAIGLAGAALFAFRSAGVQFLGSLLFLAHSILDGCDGELARLKFQESRAGGVLDFWGDNLVHAAVFSGIAVSWARSAGAAWPLAFGAVAVTGTALSAALVYFETMRGDHAGPLFRSVASGGEGALARAADALARRDFIYVVVVLSAFGKARWFLALAAVGAPAYFLVLGIMAIRARRTRSAI